MGVPLPLLVLLLHRHDFSGISLSLFFQALFTVALKCSFAVYGDHRDHQKASGFWKRTHLLKIKREFIFVFIFLCSSSAIPRCATHIFSSLKITYLYCEEIFNDCLSWLPGFLCSWAEKKLVVLNNWLCLDGLHSSLNHF